MGLWRGSTWRVSSLPQIQAEDTLAERLRRRPAKPMGSPRVGSNPTGVDLTGMPVQDKSCQHARGREAARPILSAPILFEGFPCVQDELSKAAAACARPRGREAYTISTDTF